MEGVATTMADVSTALVTAVTSIATQALSTIASVLPVAAPVFGAILLVGIGIKAFKRFTGR